MEKAFKINSQTVWFFTIISLYAITEGVFFNYFNHKEMFIGMGLISYFFVWIIILLDILNNPVYNKNFWFISMFILPYITVIVYLLRRNALIAHGILLLKKQKNEKMKKEES